MVIALIGLCRGMVRTRVPLVITICLTLPCDPKSGLLQRLHGAQVIDAWIFWHRLSRDIDLTYHFPLTQVIYYGKILCYRIRDILQGFGLRGSLRMTTRESRNGYGEAFFRLLKYDAIFHISIPRFI